MKKSKLLKKDVFDFSEPMLVNLKLISSENSNLNVIEFGHEIPFLVKRNYVINSKNETINKGFHAKRQKNR